MAQNGHKGLGYAASECEQLPLDQISPAVQYLLYFVRCLVSILVLKSELVPDSKRSGAFLVVGGLTL